MMFLTMYSTAPGTADVSLGVVEHSPPQWIAEQDVSCQWPRRARLPSLPIDATPRPISVFAVSCFDTARLPAPRSGTGATVPVLS